MYELFVTLHVPVAMLFLGMLFWHCNNYLSSWSYLFTTLGIWLVCYFMRLFYLNWTNPFRMSWLIGDEAAVTIMHENAINPSIQAGTLLRSGGILSFPARSYFPHPSLP